MTNPKGARRERELVNRLGDAGWFAIRAPASGSATADDLPDVAAGDGNVSVAIEAKSSSGDPIYVGKDEVSALNNFAAAFRAHALIGVRFDRREWWFFPPEELHDAGQTLRVKESALGAGPGIPLEHLHEVEDWI